MLLLPACAPRRATGRRARRQRVGLALDDSFRIGDAVFQIGASVGIAIYPGDGARRRVDCTSTPTRAMYVAKEQRRGHAVYEPSDPTRFARLSLARRLRRALDAREFELHYQPVVQLTPPRVSAASRR